jgi:hypothetical protein
MLYCAKDAAEAIRSGRVPGPIEVSGRLDLTKFDGDRLPPCLHCYELDASGSQLTALPSDLRIDGRLVLDNCPALTTLPRGLTAGSISMRNCPSLVALPEELCTWFLDLSGCEQFAMWPASGAIHHGSLVLRNCTSMAELPAWIKRLASLDVAGCVQLREIPDGISVSSWVDIGGTRLSGLPPSLAGASLRWRSVRIDERIAFHPERITAEEVLAERNAEVRRVMIERMGYLRFAKEAQAKVLDEDQDQGGLRQLLKIDLLEDEALVGLFCNCPSTRRQYFLRVPPAMRTCHQAAAWMAGFEDPKLYHPEIET